MWQCLSSIRDVCGHYDAMSCDICTFYGDRIDQIKDCKTENCPYLKM